MVRSFGLGIPGTRNVYIFVSIVFNVHSNVNITSSRNSEPKRTHHKSCFYARLKEDEVGKFRIVNGIEFQSNGSLKRRLHLQQMLNVTCNATRYFSNMCSRIVHTRFKKCNCNTQQNTIPHFRNV